MSSDTTNMINELLDAESGRLTIQEIDFLENVSQQNYPLTPAQEAWLQDIWQKVFGD